jgi:hypothetical protein
MFQDRIRTPASAAGCSSARADRLAHTRVRNIQRDLKMVLIGIFYRQSVEL